MGPQVVLNKNAVIPSSLGTQSGANLFHSFHRFEIAENGSATFTADASIENIVSRVTGGIPSTIQGLLRSEAPNADFYLINPAGIMFSGDGSVDLPASLFLSTAGQLNFSDNLILETGLNNTSTLSLAIPETFGFLGSNADLTVDSAAIDLQQGQDLFLAGGNIRLLSNVAQARLSSGNGRINLVAVGNSDTDISLSSTPPDGLTGTIETSGPGDQVVIGVGPSGHSASVDIRAGSLSMSNSALLSTGDESSVVIEAGQLTLSDRTLILGDSINQTDAANLFLNASERINITDSFISSDSTTAGNAGNIEIVSAGPLEITGSAGISSNSGSSGAGGEISISAQTVYLEGRSSDAAAFITSRTDSTGQAGHIRIAVDDALTLRSDATVSTSTSSESDAASIDIQAIESVQISSGSTISASTTAEGNAGRVEISTGNLDIDRRERNVTGIISAARTGSAGNAGSVSIDATGKITVRNGGLIANDTFSSGDGGLLSINSRNLLLDGASAVSFTGITASSDRAATGNGGSVTVNVEETLEILSGAELSNSTFAAGNGGDLVINAGTVEIDGRMAPFFTGIQTASNESATGNAGNLSVSAQNSTRIVNGGQISAATFGPGNGGTIQLTTGKLHIDAQQSQIRTDVRAISDSTGGAGDITIRVSGNAEILNSGSVTVSSTGTGSSGTLDVQTGGSLTIDNQAAISSNANQGSAGNIQIDSQTLVLRNSEISSTTNDSIANGGNITLASDIMVLSSGLIQANAESGRGGEIILTGNAVIPERNQLNINPEERQVFLLDGPSTIQSVAPTGVSLTPVINAPEPDISAAINTLDEGLPAQPRLSDNPCTAYTDSAPGSLTRLGRGGLAPHTHETTLIDLSNISLVELKVSKQLADNDRTQPSVATNDTLNNSHNDSCG